MKTKFALYHLLWSLLAALPWLVPNHQLPWTSFHAEALWAFALLVLGLLSLWRIQSRIELSGLAVILVVGFCVSWIQFQIGLVRYFGHAWLVSLYFLGALIAWLVARSVEKCQPGLVIEMLCLSFGMAAICSVGMQLCQWLQMDGLGIWVNEVYGRPAGNLGQSNHLAVLIVWALISGLYAFERGYIGAVTLGFYIAFLVFGLALTASRTGVLLVISFAAGAWLWRGLFSRRETPWIISAIFPLLFGFQQVVNFLGDVAVTRTYTAEGYVAEPRLLAWNIFLDALAERAWLGYGLNQASDAHVLHAESYPALGVVFGQAHNFFIEVLVTTGIPIGLMFCLGLVWLMWKMFGSVANGLQVFCFFLVGSVFIHSLVENPFFYTYFLLPFAMLVGVISQQQGLKAWQISLPKWGVASVTLVGILAFSATLFSYFRVEEEYRFLRMEWAGFHFKNRVIQDDFGVLNQWPEIFSVGRGDDAQVVEVLERVLLEEHKPLYFRTYATELRRQGREDEADRWLLRLCKVQPAYVCALEK